MASSRRMIDRHSKYNAKRLSNRRISGGVYLDCDVGSLNSKKQEPIIHPNKIVTIHLFGDILYSLLTVSDPPQRAYNIVIPCVTFTEPSPVLVCLFTGDMPRYKTNHHVGCERSIVAPHYYPTALVSL